MEKELAACLNVPIKIYPFQGYDEFGSPIFGEPTLEKCYLISAPRTVREEVALELETVNHCQLFLNRQIHELDRIEFQDGRTFVILDATTWYDENGNFYYTKVRGRLGGG